MQKGLARFLFSATLSLALAVSACAKSPVSLQKADSLFTLHQYTQALELYELVYNSGNYTSAMLLKLAYIHEGLGHLGESLFYLNLYYLASDDPQALKKMEELAEKNRLEGYEVNETTRAYAWLQEQYASITIALSSFMILLLSAAWYQWRWRKSTPSLAVSMMVIIGTVLLFHVNFTREARRGIVTGAPTYLMSGPSSGSSVIAIVGEGHQLTIQGQEDVWLRVSWKDQDVFVKSFLIRAVKL